jgi:hypothetical protein
MLRNKNLQIPEFSLDRRERIGAMNCRSSGRKTGINFIKKVIIGVLL